jgi:hypothetical protein
MTLVTDLVRASWRRRRYSSGNTGGGRCKRRSDCDIRQRKQSRGDCDRLQRIQSDGERIGAIAMHANANRAATGAVRDVAASQRCRGQHPCAHESTQATSERTSMTGMDGRQGGRRGTTDGRGQRVEIGSDVRHRTMSGEHPTQYVTLSISGRVK